VGEHSTHAATQRKSEITLSFYTFVPCIAPLSKIYSFTNWCTSELS